MPPAVVLNVYPVRGPTVILAVVRLVPVIVNEYGPAVVPIHTPVPKDVNAVAVNVEEGGTWQIVVPHKVVDAAHSLKFQKEPSVGSTAVPVKSPYLFRPLPKVS